MLAGLARSLDRARGIEVVGEASRGSQVLPLIAQTSPDVLLLDLEMPDLDGIACLQRIRRQHIRIRSIILSASTDPGRIEEARAAGAVAFIVKCVGRLDLPSLIARVVAGEPFFVHGLEDAVPAGLSERELAILRALASGRSNRQISSDLWLSEQTVKFHLVNLYRKLKVSNRTEAVRWGCRIGLTTPGARKASKPPVARDDGPKAA
jgi:DNA-binding NarL/FixJ family response regulator